MHAEIAYLFRHALLRDAAYQLQLPGARARLHALALELIEIHLGGRPPALPPLAPGRSAPAPPHPTDPFALELAEHAALAPPSPDRREARRGYLRRGAMHAGRCYRLPNVPGFEGVNIRQELERRLGLPVAVENDSTTAALGELLFGHGRAHQSFLVATLGTGVGGGLVIDGALRRGAHGFAAEIGHLLVDSSPSAPVCVCGLRGCMEVFAGTRGLMARYAELA
ncbi:MAG: ROK family protein, partial [Candidatus Brocadiae bacterium]|nr:ROK family protein [Candidatus Brocadiia bacterium]